MVDQRLPPLGLLDVLGLGQQRLQVAVIADQLCGGLDPDAGRAGDVVDAVAGQRLHVDDTIGRHAELRLHLLGAEARVLHRVEHLDAAAHQLHQVLVAGDDGDAPARLARLAGIGGDDVVGLEVLHLDAGDVEGARRLAGQRDLRAQILGHLLAVGLVGVVKVVAEGVAALVEDHRDMGGGVGAFVVLHHLEDHVAKARHRADRQPVGLAAERRQRVERTEDEGRAVHQVQMAPLAEAAHSPALRAT